MWNYHVFDNMCLALVLLLASLASCRERERAQIDKLSKKKVHLVVLELIFLGEGEGWSVTACANLDEL